MSPENFINEYNQFMKEVKDSYSKLKTHKCREIELVFSPNNHHTHRDCLVCYYRWAGDYDSYFTNYIKFGFGLQDIEIEEYFKHFTFIINKVYPDIDIVNEYQYFNIRGIEDHIERLRDLLHLRVYLSELDKIYPNDICKNHLALLDMVNRDHFGELDQHEIELMQKLYTMPHFKVKKREYHTLSDNAKQLLKLNAINKMMKRKLTEAKNRTKTVLLGNRN